MSESKPAPGVKWPSSPTLEPGKGVQIRNVNFRQRRGPKAVIRFECPECKKKYALTLDKKTSKSILADIKAGGNPVPPGYVLVPVTKQKEKQDAASK